MSTVRTTGRAMVDPAQDKDLAKLKATCSLSASFNAATLVQALSVQGELNLIDLFTLLGERCKEVHGGDLKHAENMLIAQAHSLDAMFANLARRGLAQEGLEQYQAHMKLALKAQSQCRATLETLAAIKNPPVVFAKQANIANGPQQVNNNADGFAGAREIETKPNELLETGHEQWLDTGTARKTGASDQAMATVEAVHRPSNSKGQGRGKSKRMEGRNATAPAPRRGGPK